MCYMRGSVNDSTGGYRDYICPSCVDNCTGIYGPSTTLAFVLKNNMVIGEPRMCFQCDKVRHIVFHMAVHKGCAYVSTDD